MKKSKAYKKYTKKLSNKTKTKKEYIFVREKPIYRSYKNIKYFQALRYYKFQSILSGTGYYVLTKS